MQKINLVFIIVILFNYVMKGIYPFTRGYIVQIRAIISSLWILTSLVIYFLCFKQTFVNWWVAFLSFEVFSLSVMKIASCIWKKKEDKRISKLVNEMK
jgi:hypothetical protein